MLLGAYQLTGILRPSIARDPYVAGYITGKIIWLVIGITKNRLSKRDANAATGLILMNLFGDDAAEVSRCLKAHCAENSKAYQLGSARAEKLALYFFRIEDVVGDAEHAPALAWIAAARNGALGIMPELNTTSDPFTDAICGLEGLWFNDYMNRLI